MKDFEGLRYDDRYPTDEFLEWVKEQRPGQGEMRPWLAAILEEATEFMPCECEKGEREVRGQLMDLFIFHTCGWSGAEELVDALPRLVVLLCEERRDRGGHFYFAAAP